jgi:phosphoribosylcarboxyaminoimidazole (NCAIR) mutase
MKPKVLVVLGSESDWPKVKHVFEEMEWNLWIQVISASCHRNPGVIEELAAHIVDNQDYALVVCVGGKAFALPGVLDAWMYHFDHDVTIPVAGVALGDLGSRSLLAAELSITEIPGDPLLDCEGKSGPEALIAVLKRAENGNFPTPKERTNRPINTGIWYNCPPEALLIL